MHSTNSSNRTVTGMCLVLNWQHCQKTNSTNRDDSFNRTNSTNRTNSSAIGLIAAILH